MRRIDGKNYTNIKKQSRKPWKTEKRIKERDFRNLNTL